MEFIWNHADKLTFVPVHMDLDGIAQPTAKKIYFMGPFYQVISQTKSNSGFK